MLDWITKLWNRATDPDIKRPKTAFWIPKTDSGERVDHDSAMSYSVVWACVRVIAESISQLPWRVMVKTNNGNEHLSSHPADRLLYTSPNDELTPAVWRELVMHDVLTWGNAYQEIERDGSQRPIRLHRIHPSRVEPQKIEVGGQLKMAYVVRNDNNDPTVLWPEQVFHVRGLGDDLTGWSVIQAAANAIGLGKAQDKSMASLISNESRPAGLITPHGNLPRNAADRIQEEWEATFGGAGNRGRTAVLSHHMDYKPLALPNTDAQLLESRRFSVVEICRFFRVPPHKVFDLERATFSNIEHQAIEFVQDTLVPWIVKLEQEANRKLIGMEYRGRAFTKININALLRGDFESRAKGYQMLFDRGVYSVNDILELEDRNTIGTDGDLRFVPLNFQTLEQAAEPPEPPAPPEPPQMPNEDEDEDEGSEPQDNVADAYRPLLADCVDRITTREINALSKVSVDRADRLFDGGHQSYIVRQLGPHMATLGRYSPLFDPVSWAADRCEKLRAEVKAHLAAGGDRSELISAWVDRVDSTTEQILGVHNAGA